MKYCNKTEVGNWKMEVRKIANFKHLTSNILGVANGGDINNFVSFNRD
ncbi:MAG: hypothetical protein WC223_07840 [Bacteroidales bacterium]|jgi:hypothetical protein